jgi:hypothetical protein
MLCRIITDDRIIAEKNPEKLIEKSINLEQVQPSKWSQHTDFPSGTAEISPYTVTVDSVDNNSASYVWHYIY